MIMPCWSGQELVIENQYNTSAKPEPYRLVRRPGSKGWTLRAAGAATYRYFERRAALQIDVAVERKVPSSKRAAPGRLAFRNSRPEATNCADCELTQDIMKLLRTTQ